MTPVLVFRAPAHSPPSLPLLLLLVHFSPQFDPHDGRADRDRVLEGTNLVELIGESVSLKLKGREWVGLCPFHTDSKPSFAVVTHKGTPFYNCFACGENGNAYDFMMKYHSMGFVDALKFLASRIGYELTHRRVAPRPAGEPTRDEIYRANELALAYFRRVIGEDRGATARSEAARRGYDDAIIEEFKLGAAANVSDGLVEAWHKAHNNPELRKHVPPLAAFVAAGVIRPSQRGDGHYDLLRNRLIFPICDEMGRTIAFGGRKLDPEDEPKYINSPESPIFHKGSTIYGLDRARQTIKSTGMAIVTEGYTDVIACHRAGITNAVATLGTAFTREHARKLGLLSTRVTLLFDGDEAGQKAADRAIEVYFQENIDVRICTLPDGLDPDDLLKQPDGRARFDAALVKSANVLEYMVTRLRKQDQKCDGPASRGALIERVAQRLAELGSINMPGLRRQLVLDSFAPTLRIPFDVLDKEVRAHEAKIGARSTRMDVRTPREEASIPAAIPRRTFAIQTPQQRARLSAERHILAPLLCAPSLAAMRVNIEGEASLEITEALTVDSLTLDTHRTIYSAILGAAESNTSTDFGALLSSIECPHARTIAIEMERELHQILRPPTAKRLSSQDPEPTIVELRAELCSAWKALESLDRRHLPHGFGGNSNLSERLDGRAGEMIEVSTEAPVQTQTEVHAAQNQMSSSRTPIHGRPEVANSTSFSSQIDDAVAPAEADLSGAAFSSVTPPLSENDGSVLSEASTCSSADEATNARMNRTRARGADPTAIRRLPRMQSGNAGANP